jgi:hypothetical protein
MAKLQNIKALKQMLDGNHRMQTRKTIGFSDAKDTAKIREVGEIWEETDQHGNTIWWEQKQGYRVKYGVHPEIAQTLREAQEYLSSFPNCQKETCTCKQPTRIDEKFRKLVGMCEDCLISYETSLKIKGEFNEYAMKKMEANAKAFFEQADKEVEVLKREISNIHFAGDENDVNPIETWKFQDEESYKKFIDEKYNEFKTKTLEKFGQ